MDCPIPDTVLPLPDSISGQLMSVRSDALLVAKGLQRIDSSGTASRNVAGDGRNEQEHENGNARSCRIDCMNSEEGVCQQARHHISHNDSESSSDYGNPKALAHDQAQDISGLRAEGKANADFVSPLLHGI